MTVSLQCPLKKFEASSLEISLSVCRDVILRPFHSDALSMLTVGMLAETGVDRQCQNGEGAGLIVDC